MKRPHRPSKPYKPTKPVEAYEIPQYGELWLNDGESIAELLERLNKEGASPVDAHFHLNDDSYGDDPSYYTVRFSKPPIMQPNNGYKRQMANYSKALKRYNEAMPKWEAAMKKYEEDEEKWQEEDRKKQIERLEKRLLRLKKGNENA